MDLLRDYDEESQDEEATLSILPVTSSVRPVNSELQATVALNNSLGPASVALVLSTATPAEAQQLIPLRGPLLPSKQNKPGGLYNNFRNHPLGHRLECTESAAVGLAAKNEEETAEWRRKNDAFHSKKRQKLEEELGLDPLVLKGRASNDDPASEGFLGPWAPFEADLQRREKIDELMKSNAAELAGDLEKITKTQEAAEARKLARNMRFTEPTFTLHVQSINRPDLTAAHNILVGRSWMEPSQQPAKVVDSFQLPKKVTNVMKGHTKSVSSIQWFPTSEHLMLSGSMDRTVKMWDVRSAYECVATYTGHSQGVKQAVFAGDGKRFYSCGMDRNICEWDTEKGVVITTLGNGYLPHSLAVAPKDPAVIVCGHQNKKAVQYDSRSGKVEQEYSEHLGPVITTTFSDGGSKLITTSDDKRMFVWEYGMTVVMKYIADPRMHLIPAVTLDPTGEYLACQSINNQIVLYEAKDRFRLQSHRRFKGHTCTGYAVKPGFSPDSRFLMSGDTHGKLFFWDYANGKLQRSFESGHRDAVMCAIWNKYGSIATGGWDGLITVLR